MRTHPSAIFLIFLLALASCKRDDPPDIPPPVLDGGVYIINEGNFQWGNGTIDYMRFADNTYSEDIFASANSWPLGDVVQSMCVYNGKAYIVVNNSAKVEVVSITDFKSAGTITGLTSPRYFLPLGGCRAYISDLYSNNISIVDINNLQVTGQIPLKGSSEEMLLSGNRVFVTNTRSACVYVLDTAANIVVDSIVLSYATNSLKMDAEQKIWVLCAGDQLQSINAGLYRIDPVTLQVISSFDLGNPIQIWDRLSINGTGDFIYYSDNGIWRMGIGATELPAWPLIPPGGHLFHGLGIDPGSETVYVSDAIDYVQKGKVYRYQKDGVLIDSMLAGIIPSAFYFE
jgi:YVTN family beta-propeller protein